MTELGFDGPLYILPFDHHGSIVQIFSSQVSKTSMRNPSRGEPT